MTSSPDIQMDELKEDVIHLEVPTATVAATEKQEVMLDSAYARTPLWVLARKFWKAGLYTIGVSIGALFDGYAVTIPGAVSANKSFILKFGTVKTGSTVALDATYVAAWGGMSSGLQLVGMILSGLTCDRFGRKFNCCMFTTIIVIAIALELTSVNWLMFDFARGIAGLGTGIARATLTCYLAELSPSGLRGAYLTAYSWMYALGQFASAVALQIVQTHNLSWRSAFYSEIVFVGIFVPVIILLPESPWYYANKGNHEGAKRMLLKMNGNVPGYDVEAEYAVIAGELAVKADLSAKSAAASWKELFVGVNGRRTWISFLPLATQMFVGNGLVFGYFAYFFSIAGVANPFTPTIATNAILLGGILAATITVDKIGRKTLLMVTEVINMVTILLMGVVGTLQKRNGGVLSDSMANGIVVLACIWVAAYAVGPGPLGYAFVADVSTPLLRAKTTAMGTALVGIFGLIFAYVVPIMLSPQKLNWGAEIGYFYAPLTLIGLVLMYFTVPEIKGRTFVELDELFERRISARKFASTKTHTQAADGTRV